MSSSLLVAGDVETDSPPTTCVSVCVQTRASARSACVSDSFPSSEYLTIPTNTYSLSKPLLLQPRTCPRPRATYSPYSTARSVHQALLSSHPQHSIVVILSAHTTPALRSAPSQHVPHGSAPSHPPYPPPLAYNSSTHPPHPSTSLTTTSPSRSTSGSTTSSTSSAPQTPLAIPPTVPLTPMTTPIQIPIPRTLPRPVPRLPRVRHPLHYITTPTVTLRHRPTQNRTRLRRLSPQSSPARSVSCSSTNP